MSEDHMHYYRAYLAFRDAAEYALTKYLEAERGDNHAYYAKKAISRADEGLGLMMSEPASAPKLEAAE